MNGCAMQAALRGLPVLAEIGIHPHEIGRRQRQVICIESDIAAVEADGIAATVDYRLPARHAEDVSAERIGLIETFAVRLAERCLAAPGAQRVRVRVDKPGALPVGTASASVTRVNAGAYGGEDRDRWERGA